jgi:hypothetical protein
MFKRVHSYAVYVFIEARLTVIDNFRNRVARLLFGLVFILVTLLIKFLF